jgi:hypothetical protein
MYLAVRFCHDLGARDGAAIVRAPKRRRWPFLRRKPQTTAFPLSAVQPHAHGANPRAYSKSSQPVQNILKVCKVAAVMTLGSTPEATSNRTVSERPQAPRLAVHYRRLPPDGMFMPLPWSALANPLEPAARTVATSIEGRLGTKLNLASRRGQYPGASHSRRPSESRVTRPLRLRRPFQSGNYPSLD